MLVYSEMLTKFIYTHECLCLSGKKTKNIDSSRATKVLPNQMVERECPTPKKPNKTD